MSNSQSPRSDEARRYINSSSFVMAVIFTILCGMAALSFGFFINYFTSGHFEHSTKEVLDTRVRLIEAIGLDRSRDDRHPIYILSDKESLPEGVKRQSLYLAKGFIVFESDDQKRTFAGHTYNLDDGRKVLVATDISEIRESFHFMQFLGWCSVGFVMIVVFFSYLISVFVVSGTNKIADTARDIINTGDLSRRIDVGSRWDDLSNMGAVLNMLLDRVEDLMHGVRQVSDNIAHDLRTPLTRMRGHIESLDDEKRDELLSEADHILDTFNALLRISRIESEKQKSQFEKLNLNVILEDVCSFYEPLAEEKNIEIIKDFENLPFYGDRDLLFQVYANLLDNALKFTPQHGQITLKATKLKGIIEVNVDDNGHGVDSNDIGNIFKRFYRGEKSRSSSGTGLGLSLVKAVVELHGGKVSAQNLKPGFRIITKF